MIKRTSVPPLFARPALMLRLLLLVAITLPLNHTIAQAASKPYLFPLPAQAIFAGQAFSYLLVPTAEYQPSYFIKLLNAPQGSTLLERSDGTSEFRWTPPVGVGAETVILVQVFDATNSKLMSAQRMILRLNDDGVIDSKKSLVSLDTSPNISNTTAVLEGVSSVSQSGPNENTATPIQAPTLPEIGQQFLQVGEEYQLFVKSTNPEGAEVNLTAYSIPAGAEFEEIFGQSRLLRWRPTPSQVGDHLMVLSAIDKLDSTRRVDRVVVLHVVDNAAVAKPAIVAQKEAAAIVASPVDTEKTPEMLAAQDAALFMSEKGGLAPLDQTLSIEPISSQIVSVGRVVRFPVVPRTSDNTVPFLHVDRLPRNASFDENPDGSRTFYWETAQADQGSHTFRFTAIHPKDVNLSVTIEAMVVVGDPGLPSSSEK